MLTEEEKLTYSSLSSRTKELEALLSEQQKKREDLISDVLRRSILSGSWAIKGDSYGARLQPADNKTKRDIHKLLQETFRLGWHDSIMVPFEGFSLYVRVDDGDVLIDLEVCDESDFSAFRKNGVQVEENSLAEYFCSGLETELERREQELERGKETLEKIRSKIDSVRNLIRDQSHE